MIVDDSFPFHAVYLIDANTGINLVSMNYSENHFDVDVISGMFRALEMFINHLAYSKSFQQLQEINFQGVRIVYERFGRPTNPILCVGVSKKNDDLECEHLLLRQILTDFYMIYEGLFENFHGNVVPFREYKNYLASIQTTWYPEFKQYAMRKMNENLTADLSY